MSRPSVRRGLCWFLFLAVLFGLGALLWHWLPPEPRWLIPSDCRPHAMGQYGGRPVVVLQAVRPLGERLEFFGPVKLWDLELGCEIPFFFDNAHVHTVWTPPYVNGRFLFCELDGGKVGLVDFHKEREVRLELDKSDLRLLCFSADGRYLAAQDSSKLQLFETATGKSIEEFAGMVHGCDFDPSSRFLPIALRNDPLSAIDLWSIEEKQVVQTFHNLAVELTFAPDGEKVCAAIAGKDGVAAWTVWDTRTWERILPLDCHPKSRYLHFSPDGKVVVSWFEDEEGISRLKFWDCTTWKKLGMASAASNVELVAFSPDSREVIALATTFRDQEETILASFDTHTGEQLWERKSRTRWRPWHPVHVRPTVGLFWPDKKQVELLDPRTGATIRTIAVPNFRRLHSVSPKGELLVAGMNLNESNEARKGIWESLRNLLLPKIRLPQTEHCLAIVDVQSGLELARLENDLSPAGYSVSDSRYLITQVMSEAAPTIRIWDIPPPKPWRYIVGGPAALGFLIFAWHYWRIRRKRRRPAVRNPI
ncbi:MAG: WD40 repeat domain-containing protein [Gemmataceae bacterium]|nr:WD40 repeat domain-containing protein [Gemmataceae bacterium]MCI0739332.1 WD40 repeat domain-containing protein [Gemmataceae bacterium]